MKKNQITDKEIYSKEELELFKALEDDIDNDTYKPLESKQLKKEQDRAKLIVQNTIKRKTRKKSLNLRVFEEDIQNIKAIAMEKGLPYQTLLSSIIHQVANKRISI
jgi:predicted DNA binding CopG/RHH family protein